MLQSSCISVSVCTIYQFVCYFSVVYDSSTSHSPPSPVSPEPPLLIDASECDERIWPVADVPLPPTNSRWSPRRCRRRRNRLRRNEPELRTPAILLKSAASDPVVDGSVMSQVLRRRLPSSSSLHDQINFMQHSTQLQNLFTVQCSQQHSQFVLCALFSSINLQSEINSRQMNEQMNSMPGNKPFYQISVTSGC